MIFLFSFSLYYIIQYRHPKKFVTPSSYQIEPNYFLRNSDSNLNQIDPMRINYSDYRFVFSIILLVIVVLMSIPVGGLTGFHIYLIAQGRTTNEQVTGKYRIQNDVFNRGFWKNITRAFCQPLYPQLKSAKNKRYDVDLFEQMAYGKSSSSFSDFKQNPIALSNGSFDDRTNLHVNPIDERSSLNNFHQVEFFSFRFVLVRRHQNSNQHSKLPVS